MQQPRAPIFRGDSFTYENESPCPDGYVCQICTCPAYNPLIHAACGRVYCKGCIGDIPAPRRCPNCRRAFAVDLSDLSSVLDITMRTTLHELKVKCEHCEVFVARGVYETHESCQLRRTLKHDSLFLLSCCNSHFSSISF